MNIIYSYCLLSLKDIHVTNILSYCYFTQESQCETKVMKSMSCLRNISYFGFQERLLCSRTQCIGGYRNFLVKHHVKYYHTANEKAREPGAHFAEKHDFRAKYEEPRADPAAATITYE